MEKTFWVNNMLAIWKFPLLITDRQSLRMPGGAQVLTVQFQREKLCLWALVDVNSPSEMRTFEVIGTGNEIHPESDGEVRNYICSVQEERVGPGSVLASVRVNFVWHIFELLELQHGTPFER